MDKHQCCGVVMYLDIKARFLNQVYKSQCVSHIHMKILVVKTYFTLKDNDPQPAK